MCGRYYIEISDEELQEVCDALDKSREVFPSDMVPIMTNIGEYQSMKWGFTGFDGKLLINARSETALTKPTFQDSMLKRRCVIPASGYYEWRRDGNKKIKHQIYIPGRPIYLAGCFRQEKDSTHKRFVILTREAAGGLEKIHDRMPVIIPRCHIKNWLNGNPDVISEYFVSQNSDSLDLTFDDISGL